MPTFLPPLAHESRVPIPSDSSDKFVQLDFFLTFDSIEDSSGSWEIWTDLPRLDDEGAVISQQGEWHAATFASLSDEPNHLSNWSSTSGSPSQKSRTTSRTLTFIVPATPGQSYSYTYRRVPVEGEIQWLGGLGGNGFIRLETGAANIDVKLDSVGKWNNLPENIVDLSWNGIGIEYDEKSGLPPSVVTLPTTAPASPIVVLLRATAPVHQSPLFRLLSVNKAFPARPATHCLGIVGDLFAPLGIAAASALPTTAGASAAYASIARSGSRAALEAALRAGKVDQNRLRLLEVEGKETETLGDITALALTPALGDPNYSYIVIHAPSSDRSRNIAVNLPADFINSAPLLALSTRDSSSAFVAGLPDSGDSESARSVPLQLDAGAISEVLKIVEFVELRASGGSDSLWLAAPDAGSFEIGEEEIDVPAVNEAIAAEPKLLAAPVEISDAVVQETDRESVEVDESESQASVAEQRVEGNVSEVLESSDPADDTQGWWLLDAIGHIFINFWHLIFGLMANPPAAIEDSHSGAESELDGNDEPNENARKGTPTPDETTPLLGSETLSRATSSTAFSPLASPASTSNGKLDHFAPSNNLTTVATEITSAQTASHITEQSITNFVEIRSYALASFVHAPPFRFFLTPEGADSHALDKLRFAYKLKTDKDWESVVPVMTKGAQHDLVELEVGVAQETASAHEWEVQVERV